MAGIIRSTPLGGRDIILVTRGMVGDILIIAHIRLTLVGCRHAHAHHTLEVSHIVRMLYIVLIRHVREVLHPSLVAAVQVAHRIRQLHRVAQMFVVAVER